MELSNMSLQAPHAGTSSSCWNSSHDDSTYSQLVSLHNKSPKDSKSGRNYYPHPRWISILDIINPRSGPMAAMMMKQQSISQQTSCKWTCTKLGVSLQHWQEYVTTMLEKYTRHPKLHWLRVIHLLEADLNQMIKILLAWCFIWHSKEHDACGKAQVGSQPGRSAINVVLQKELIYDLAASTLYNLAMMENDATTCFNTMVTSLVMISLQAPHGVPKQVIILMGKTLKKMWYIIKTKIGISKWYYQHMEEDPIYGTGQGSTQTCLVSGFSSALFSAMSYASLSTAYSSLKTLKLTMEAFIDNTDIAVNDAETPYTSHEPTQVRQIDAQHWEKLLFSSGENSSSQNVSLIYCTGSFWKKVYPAWPKRYSSLTSSCWNKAST